MTDLVIVESPAKAKTIGKYLGKRYSVKACMGHLRDLPKSKFGVDIDGGFIPDYKPVSGKEELIEELRSHVRDSNKVFLATDPDREGEAISWHLRELLDIPEGKSVRVTFNEITEKVVKESMERPRDIDSGLVDAQQARRVLDRIVGYKLSPLLWRKIRRGLSAGRVQSVATRIVVDREREIREFVPEEYWLLDAVLAKGAANTGFTARFHGDEKKKLEIKSEAEANKIMSAVKAGQFTVRSIKRAEKRRSPSPPFITSTLQQEASRRLGMTPKRTMAVAQQLYEGVNIKSRGTTGLITYMRTDSLRISEEAAGEARNFIISRYGAAYYPQGGRRYKTKNAAQDAHEAIRPSYPGLDPEDIKDSLNKDQYRLYKLIWSRFTASQMADALYDSLTVDFLSGGYVFRANSAVLKFAGFTALYEEGRDEEREEANEKLPELQEGEALKLLALKHEQKFTQPPARYTEATLVRAMEEKGVGRPSTYAPTISTIMDREYVVREAKHLRPTPLGEVVTELMAEKFNDIIDVDFTAKMEENLDGIEGGKKDWKAVLNEFYQNFDAELKKAESDLSDVRIKVPDELSDVVCDLCGKQMVIKSGRFGRFLACPGYPECKNTKPITEETPGVCPACGGKILKKKSKNGYTYFGCEKSPGCSFMTWDVPVADKCPACGKGLYKKSGRGPKKPFCINEACREFLPEDKRGFPKKTDAAKAAGTAGKEAKATSKAASRTKTSKTKTTAKSAKTTAKPASKARGTRNSAKSKAAEKTEI